MKGIFLLFLSLLCVNCIDKPLSTEPDVATPINSIEKTAVTSIVILGTVQDAGAPQIGCEKECCASLYEHSNLELKVVSLGVIDSKNKKSYLFEATPNIVQQVHTLQQYANLNRPLPDGIFLTHAHIGHYSGLMYLGKESINATKTPVFAMPKMKIFLEENGPWSQLVQGKNIDITSLKNEEELVLSTEITIVPLTVPHRDEFSETVGYKIIGPTKSVLFIPDIDKWEKWEQDIVTLIGEVDYAFLDATFYDGHEINSRDISEIPHPFVIESMNKFEGLPSEEKKKIYFIHFNHTNPLLNPKSAAYKKVIQSGYKVATSGQIFLI